MSNPNNGGACFTCSICHRECCCINESVRDGVCVDCYDHIQNTLHDGGGNCFTCSSCHRTCSCCNESVMNGICEECYQIHIYEQQHEFEGDGGNCFKCAICGRQCHCLNESHVDGVCVECIAAASRLGQENNLENIVFCSICHQYKIRGNDETHKGVCSSCYNSINNLEPNQAIYLSSTALSDVAANYIKSSGKSVVARYLTNSSIWAYSSKDGCISEDPYTNEEHLDQEELNLAIDNNIFLVSVYHSWFKCIDPIAAANYDAYLAIKLAKNIHQPSGSTIYFEIPERLKFSDQITAGAYTFKDLNDYYAYLNNYTSKLIEVFAADNNYGIGIICGYDYGELHCLSFNQQVISLYENNNIKILKRARYNYIGENSIVDLEKPLESNLPALGDVMKLYSYNSDNTPISLGAWLPTSHSICNNEYSLQTDANTVCNQTKEYGFDSSGILDDTAIIDHTNLVNSNLGYNANVETISFVGRYLNMNGPRHILDTTDTNYIITRNNNEEYIFLFTIFQSSFSTADAYFTEAQGRYDGMIACWLAERINQPGETPIYFAVDKMVYTEEEHESVTADLGFDPKAHIANVMDYFSGIVSVMKKYHYNPRHYYVGVYGRGILCQELNRTYNNNIYVFLPAAYRDPNDYTQTRWNIAQMYIESESKDLDETSTSFCSGCWSLN